MSKDELKNKLKKELKWAKMSYETEKTRTYHNPKKPQYVIG